MPFFPRRWFSRPDPRHIAVPDSTEPVDAAEQFLLGLKFAGGQGVVQDFTQAAHWYGRAAEQNHSLAQLSLSTLCAQGLGIARDEAKSLLWLTRSARLGNAAAQYKLGVRQHLACRHRKPEAPPEIRIEALKWVRLASAQGERGAENACEFVALGMSLEEVAEAGRRAAAFVAEGLPAGPLR